MAVTISCSRLPVDPTQRGDLEKMFGSSPFLLFKEMVGARCIMAQVDAMNAALYPDNEDAKLKFEAEQKRASDYARMLDMLDSIGAEEQNWFTVKLEHANH